MNYAYDVMGVTVDLRVVLCSFVLVLTVLGLVLRKLFRSVGRLLMTTALLGSVTAVGATARLQDRLQTSDASGAEVCEPGSLQATYRTVTGGAVWICQVPDGYLLRSSGQDGVLRPTDGVDLRVPVIQTADGWQGSTVGPNSTTSATLGAGALHLERTGDGAFDLTVEIADPATSAVGQQGSTSTVP